MAKVRRRRPSISPVATDTMSVEDRDDLIDSGWRVFEIADSRGRVREFIVPSRKAPPPTTGGRLGKLEPLPRPTYSYETKGPYKGQRIDLVAWPYSNTTISEIDHLTTREGKPISRRWRRLIGATEAPKTISGRPGLFAYAWTDTGLHVYQHGKHPTIKGSDTEYERISRDNRGWYGDRVRSKDQLTARTLVTNDEKAAEAWLMAGGKVRIVRDLARSYAASRQRRGFR